MTARLDVQATGERTITFSRDFAAPRPLVWRAMTDPALVLRWMFARDIPLTRCEQDFRVGGTLRWEWTRPDGAVMGLSGVYRRIEAPSLTEHTEVFDEDWTGGETLVTLRLTEIDPARTRMHQTVLYSGTAARDAALASPMAEGMDEAYGRLDELLPTFAAAPVD